MIMEGTMIFHLRGNSDYIQNELVDLLNQGWRIKLMEHQRDWPRFWNHTYHLTMVKDVIVDSKHIIETPINEFK